MSEFEQASKAAKAAYFKGSAAQVRQAVDRALEEIGSNPSQPSSELLALMVIGIETDVVLTEFEDARKKIHAALLLVQELPPATREDARLDVQSLQLMLALKEGSLQAAVELCITLFDPTGLTQGGRLIAGKFLRFVAELMRELGLLDTALDVVDYMERRLMPESDTEQLAFRLDLNHLRISMSSHALGRPMRSQGPLGWQPVQKDRAEAASRLSAAATHEAIERARSLGLDAYVNHAQAILEGATNTLHRPQDLERRIQAERSRLQFFREAGLLCDQVTQELGLVGLYITAGQLDLAADLLQRTREGLRQRGHVVRLEEWYWQMYRYQHERNQPALALGAYQKYAVLADARHGLASQLLARGHRLLKALGPVAGHDATEADKLLGRLRAVAKTADSVEALAAGMNISTRRLQQLLKAHGLPPPAAHLREVQASRPVRPSGRKGPESIWGSGSI